MEQVKLLFICYGNICRSTMAQSIMTDLAARNNLSNLFEIDSAGTSDEELGNPVYASTVKELQKNEIPVISHKARKLTREDYDHYDLLLCMEDKNVEAVLEITGGDPDKKIHRVLDVLLEPRDIPDPWYTGEFDRTFEDLAEGCAMLLGTLLTKLEQDANND